MDKVRNKFRKISGNKAINGNEGEEKKEPLLCYKCKRDVDVVVCGGCNKWYCMDCEGIQRSIFNAIERCSRLRYYCLKCDDQPNEPATQPCKEELKNIFEGAMKEAVEGIKEGLCVEVVSDIKKEIGKVIAEEKELLKKSYAEVTRDFTRVTGTITNMVGSGSKRPESPPNNKVIDNVDEFVDRERRKMNLMIYNLPESDKQTNIERRNNDAAVFCNIIREEFKLNIKVASTTRLGRFDASRNRPLLVTLEDMETKREILGHAKELRQSESWGNIYISPDLTPTERERDKKLRTELKQRRDDGERDIIIRNGKIVKQHRVQKLTATVHAISSGATEQNQAGEVTTAEIIPQPTAASDDSQMGDNRQQ